MAKSQLQSNPNMMLFSGDNINIPNSIQNSVLNPATNSISAPLPNNLEMNVSIPNSEKMNFNMNNNLNNMNNNLSSAYLPNMNLGSLPSAGLGVQNLNGNNHQVSALNNGFPNQLALSDNNNNNDNMINSNYNNLNGIGFAGSANAMQQNLNPGLNLGVIGNGGLNGIPQGLNASLLPQPIPINIDNNANLALAAVPTQAQIGGVAMIGTYFFNFNVVSFKKY